MRKFLLFTLGLFIFISCQMPEEKEEPKNYYYEYANITIQAAQRLNDYQNNNYNFAQTLTLYEILKTQGTFVKSNYVSKTEFFSFLSKKNVKSSEKNRIEYQLEEDPGNTILAFTNLNPYLITIMYVEKRK